MIVFTMMSGCFGVGEREMLRREVVDREGLQQCGWMGMQWLKSQAVIETGWERGGIGMAGSETAAEALYGAVGVGVTVIAHRMV